MALVAWRRSLLARLEAALTAEGYRVASLVQSPVLPDRTLLLAFLAEQEPALVVYDLAPPYLLNWYILRWVREAEPAGRRYLLTARDPAALQAETGYNGALALPADVPEALAHFLTAVRTAAPTG